MWGARVALGDVHMQMYADVCKSLQLCCLPWALAGRATAPPWALPQVTSLAGESSLLLLPKASSPQFTLPIPIGGLGK